MVRTYTPNVYLAFGISLNLLHSGIVPIIFAFAENHFHFRRDMSFLFHSMMETRKLFYLSIPQIWNIFEGFVFSVAYWTNVIPYLNGSFAFQSFPIIHLYEFGINHCRLVNKIKLLLLFKCCCKFSKRLIEEAVIVLCLVAGVFGRMVYFLQLVEKVNILSQIQVFPRLLYFIIGLLICYAFFVRHRYDSRFFQYIVEKNKWLEKGPSKFANLTKGTKSFLSWQKCI